MNPYLLSLMRAIALSIFHVISVFQKNVAMGSFDYRGNQTDHMALLGIKSQLTDDPEGVLSSWNASVSHCSWEGVTCGNKHHRVIMLILPSKGLGGALSPFIGNLSFMRVISLTDNSLSGEIPTEIGRLFRLRSLDLDNNRLGGEIPVELGKMANLRNLYMSNNKLSGTLFKVILNLTSLERLDASTNKFAGTIPPFIGNLSFLRALDAANNSLHGQIPQEIGRLSQLRLLYLDSNSLTGEIPANISGCIKLQNLSLSTNNLQGKLPVEFGTLSSLKKFSLDENKLSGPFFDVIANLTSLDTIWCSYNSFTGSIPDSISRMTNLNSLVLTENMFSGILPPSIFNLSFLQYLYLPGNQLIGDIDIPSNLPLALSDLILANNSFSGSFPIGLLNLTGLQLIQLQFNTFTGTIQHNFGVLNNLQALTIGYNNFVGDLNFINSLVNCSNLGSLDLGGNRFTGVIPRTLANLSTTLTDVYIDKNPLNTEIPLGISNLINLQTLDMCECGLIGTIPQDLWKLHKLETLHIGSNSLKGEIPDSFGNLSFLTYLNLHDNKLEGRIPPSLGNCANLLNIDLSSNYFNGTFPFNLFRGFAKFINMDMSHNRLQGSLPVEIREQFQLVFLDVSGNNLSGNIPEGFTSLLSLQILYMDNNFFHGSILPSFTTLKNLLKVDLSRNNFSGQLPEYLSTFPLIYLNLSYNNFEGRVPTDGVFANASEIFLAGNIRLCGGIPGLHLPRCIDKARKKNSIMLKLGVPIICAIVGTLAIAACIWLYLVAKFKKRRSVPSTLALANDKEPFKKVSYDALLKATDGFSAANRLGLGSFGSVFKGNLDGITIAIKVFNLDIKGGSKSFMAECEALRKIRHRNLVEIITACSSMDFQGNEFKAIVYEFMANGSLDRWLHDLSLLQRLNIAIDVAHALNYLHQECGYIMVHCDIKPSNILLDEDFVAHVGDFGLVKILGQSLHLNQSSSVGVKGTIGYIAPEYGLGGEPSIEADLYSYGILLLELMTGKRPTDNIFREDLTLHMYAKEALPDQVLHIADSAILDIFESEEAENEGQRIKQVLQMVTKIGVACSNEIPHQRMTMNTAINQLQQARDFLLKTRSIYHI